MKKISLVFYLSLISFGEIMAQACLPDITFTGIHTTTYTKSDTWIKSSGVTTIPTGADVTWDANPLAGANGYVELNPGFETDPGAEFLAIVEAICLNNPLPVHLISFKAKGLEKKVLLTWETSSEKHSAGFEIERSGQGKNFEKIGFVKSNGSSNEQLAYNFIDETPIEGNNYYRLKLVDLDSKFEYSPTKFVEIVGRESIIIFPNPTSDFIHIEINSKPKIKSIELVNAKGSVVYRSNLLENNIDISSQPMGIYFLKIEESSGKITIRKVLKN